MPVSGQVLHEITIEQLKNVRQLQGLALDATPLVAITGANGCGKSTILHALACAYRPASDGEVNYKFPRFFLPTTDSRWEGSAFHVTHSYREGPTLYERVVERYGKAQDRWTPRYERRPERSVRFIGIETCVPHIESERATSYVELTSTPLNDKLAVAVREAASKVLNRTYTAMAKRVGRRRTYRGVQFSGLTYSSLSMGAGEQRVFEILERVLSAPKNALILIDELDLLLHEDALSKLIRVLSEHAEAKSLQIIFTTHRESVLYRDDITVHHIFEASGRTLTMPATHPDVWHRLTGKSIRTLEVFVEDDLAHAIVSRVAVELGMRMHVDIRLAGAAVNLFTLASGLALRGESLSRKLFVLDGDVYREPGAIEEGVRRVLTGHGERIEQLRAGAAQAITMLVLPEGCWPEKMIHGLLTVDDSNSADEVVRIARGINAPLERHGFLDEIVERLGDKREVAIHKVVEVASRSGRWADFTSNVRAWLMGKRDELSL